MSRAVPEQWDAGVMALNGHFLQSAAWGRVQTRLRNSVTVGADRDWCWLGVVRRAGPIRYLYLPMGPSLRDEAELGEAIMSARRRAHRLGCALLRFEPGRVSTEVAAATGARQVRPRQYQHTLILKLDQDDESLWRRVNSGHRSRINGAAKRGLRIERTDDPALMPDFVSLLRETEQRKRFFSFEDGYFAAIAHELLPTGAASLYFAVAGHTRVAAALVLDFGTTRYYAFGATSGPARKLMPAPPLVWRCITDARAEGRERFDFWGSAPPGAGADHPWAGITEFKRGFGGDPVTYAGTWEIRVRPVSAALFAVARRLRH